MVCSHSVAVHDGTFHADEVTACALLLLYNLIDRDKIFRTRDENILKNCEYICDVGGIYDPTKKLFDHHQQKYTGALSSAGMVLKYLKDQKYMEVSLYEHFNDILIKGIDAHDIGVMQVPEGVCTFSNVISNYLPIAYQSSEYQLQEAFYEALDFVYGHVKRLQKRFFHILEYRKVVKEQMDKRTQCLFFEKALPWLENFFELDGEDHPALFVIMPAGNHWKLRAIPPSLSHRMEVRMPMPKAWAGLQLEELKAVSKIPGAVFCHKGGFISIWETKEDALKALEYILQNKDKDNV